MGAYPISSHQNEGHTRNQQLRDSCAWPLSKNPERASDPTNNRADWLGLNEHFKTALRKNSTVKLSLEALGSKLMTKLTEATKRFSLKQAAECWYSRQWSSPCLWKQIVKRNRLFKENRNTCQLALVRHTRNWRRKLKFLCTERRILM